MQNLKSIWRSFKKDAATERGSSTKPGGRLGVEETIDRFETSFRNLDAPQTRRLGGEIVTRLNVYRSTFPPDTEVQFNEDIKIFCTMIRGLSVSIEHATRTADGHGTGLAGVRVLTDSAYANLVCDAQHARLEKLRGMPVPQGFFASRSHSREIARVDREVQAYGRRIGENTEAYMRMT